MQPDAVQNENKPLECRVILLGALRLYRDFSKSKPSDRNERNEHVVTERKESVMKTQTNQATVATMKAAVMRGFGDFDVLHYVDGVTRIRSSLETCRELEL